MTDQSGEYVQVPLADLVALRDSRIKTKRGYGYSHSAIDRILAAMPHPEPADPRCKGTLGSRPSWMGVDQYDPCRCRLDRGHDGPHWCEHLGSADPREADQFGRNEQP